MTTKMLLVQCGCGGNFPVHVYYVVIQFILLGLQHVFLFEIRLGFGTRTSFPSIHEQDATTIVTSSLVLL